MLPAAPILLSEIYLTNSFPGSRRRHASNRKARIAHRGGKVDQRLPDFLKRIKLAITGAQLFALNIDQPQNIDARLLDIKKFTDINQCLVEVGNDLLAINIDQPFRLVEPGESGLDVLLNEYIRLPQIEVGAAQLRLAL